MGRITDTVKHLLIINVLFFIATSLFGDQMYGLFSFWFPENENFQIWQFLSYMFMHGGLMHIMFNMYGLYAFGSPLEQMWGRNKFIFFYISTGLGAALIHTLVNYYQFNSVLNDLSAAGFNRLEIIETLNSGKYNTGWVNYVSQDRIDSFTSSFMTPMVGASGAIYGILVAFAFMFPNAELMMIFLPIPIKAKYFVPLIILGDLFFGFSSYSTGIAHFAHIGGALFGFIMMWYWKKDQFKNNRWD